MPRNEHEGYVVGPKHTCTVEQNEDKTAPCYNEFIAETYGFSHDEGHANARLIAAAPDLLAACQRVMEVCGSPDNWNGETREFLLACEAAIAKAT
jgi:hypothetical protein